MENSGADGFSNEQRQPVAGGEAAAGKEKLGARLWIESKKLWQIAGLSILSRIAAGLSMNVVTTAFAGHLGDLEPSAVSVASAVIVGFNFG